MQNIKNYRGLPVETYPAIDGGDLGWRCRIGPPPGGAPGDTDAFVTTSLQQSEVSALAVAVHFIDICWSAWQAGKTR